MNKVDIVTFLQLQGNLPESKLKVVNVRGCNGSGKSSIPLEMLRTDKDSFEVTWEREGKKLVLATVFPKYNYLAVGKYTNQCGGLDSIRDTDTIKEAFSILWDTGYNIISEGVLPSTVRKTYIDLFSDLLESCRVDREVIILNLVTPLSVCLDRVYKRNGGKKIKEELVEHKHKIVVSNHKFFEEAGFNSICVSNEDILLEDTLDWYFKVVGDFENVTLKEESKESGFPVACEDSIKNCEYYPHYKVPEGIVFNESGRDSFWKFIMERQRVYHRRVVLKEPSPWTQDPVLLKYRFTNVSRDFDKVSLYEIKHILSKLDEEGVDLEKRKRSVLLNILIYRLFVKIESYECFGGFIDLYDSNLNSKIQNGFNRLIKLKTDGKNVFTKSFMVGSRHIEDLNVEKSDYERREYNAFLIITRFIENIEEHYKNIVETDSLDKAVKYMHKTVFGVGKFNAYEIACSLAMSNRYCKNPIVTYTQDNHTSLGPGARKGLDDIFVEKGNLSYVEAIIYLRSIWDIELKRLGLYEEFLSIWPSQFNNDIDLRVIEHMLCEFDKYYRVVVGRGFPKTRFVPETTDVDSLEAFKLV